MQTLVRQAVAEDVAAILPLWRELMQFHSDFDPRYRLVPDAEGQGRAHLLAELTAPAALLIVAEHGSTAVGYCRASVPQDSPIFERRPHGFISELHVSLHYRRQGIGRSLLQYAQRWFSERGIQRLEVVTLNANESSKAFWQSVGCEAYAERRALELTRA